MRNVNASGARSRFESGRLCLDFTNTVALHDQPSPYDHIASPRQLISWLGGAGVLTEARCRKLAREAREHPAAADSAVLEARSLRETCYNIFSAIGRGVRPSPLELDRLNSVLARASSGANLVRCDETFVWKWREGKGLVDAATWPLALSAAELLASDDLGRITECEGRTCSWLFIDTTKNRSRKFCSSAGCGNRTRARRHYERLRMA
jgi:predicted RNA-binding Zn ribbon-like protein